MSDTELTKLFEGYGWHPLIVQGEDLDGELAAALDTAYGEIRELQGAAREGRRPERPDLADADRALAEGLDRHPRARRHPRRGHLQGSPGARDAGPHQPRAPAGAGGVAALLRPRGAVRRGRRPGRRDRRPCAPPASGAWAPTPTSTAGACASPLQLPELGEHAVALDAARRHDGELARRAGRIPRPGLRAQPRAAQLPRRVPRRGRLQPARRAVRGREPRLRVAGRPRYQPRLQARRAHHGGPLRAQLPGLAAGLRAHRPPRDLPLLRGVHPDRRRDGQPVRQVPEDVPRGGALARAGRVAQLPAHLGGLAPGPQRLLPPDAGLHQLDAQPPRGARAGVRAAGRQHAAGHDGPLPAGDGLHQPRDRLQAAAAAVAHDGRSPRARPRRGLDVEVGEQRRRRRARPRAGQLRHDPHDRAARRREPAARGRAGSEGALRERHQPVRAGGAGQAPRRDAGGRVRRAVHRRTGR